MKIKRGSTSVRRLIFVADSSSTTGAGLANLAYNTASLVAYYFAGDLSNEVQITLATATLGTFASGGFVAVDNTNMPGWYEIGIPDAALDGGTECALQFRGAANMVPVNIYVELDAIDYQGTPAVDVTKISGDSTAADNLEAAADGTGYNLGSGQIVAASVTGAVGSVSGAVGSASAITVERSVSDTNSITFAWPVSGATITGTKSINNAIPYTAVSGAIAFLRTETGKHYYTIAYNAADRPTAEGQVRYKFVDGTYTRYVVLRVATAVLDSAAILAVADQVWDESTSGHTTAGTYGGRIVRATNSNTEVQITGSNHIAADVHEFQAGVITAGDFAANSITASALATDAVTEIQSGLATSAALATESSKINRIEAVATGTVTGAGTSTEVFVGPSATLTITVDSSGNRSAVVVT